MFHHTWMNKCMYNLQEVDDDDVDHDDLNFKSATRAIWSDGYDSLGNNSGAISFPSNNPSTETACIFGEL